jgi:hypothetical protein
MDLRAVRVFWVRCRAGCLANLGLKLVSLVIAVIIYVLVHRPAEEPPPEPEPAAGACPR